MNSKTRMSHNVLQQKLSKIESKYKKITISKIQIFSKEISIRKGKNQCVDSKKIDLSIIRKAPIFF